MASQPLSEVVSEISATFDMRLGSVMVRPNDLVIRKLREMAEGWGMNEMVRWEVVKVERLAGLVSYIVEFLDSHEVRQARWRVMGQLEVQPGVPTGVRFMRKQVRQGVLNIFEACGKMEFGGMVRCARGLHAGMGVCAADARESVDRKLTGWSFRVGHSLRQEHGRCLSGRLSRAGGCRSLHWSMSWPCLK